MQRLTIHALLGVFAIVVASRVAVAEVIDSTANGFTVRHVVKLNVSSKEAYRIFTMEVAKWWDPAHTYSGSSSNLSIEPKPGGFFVEKLPSGGFIEHMRVVYADGGKILRMSGGLGPLQELGAAAAMTITFVEKGPDSSEVTMKFAAGGYMKQGLGSFAGIVDRVLGTQMSRYEKYATNSR